MTSNGVSNGVPAFSVDGKTAIVTGAGSGINYEFAKLLLSRNCNVVLADIALRPEAQKLVDSHTKSPRAVFQKTDVTDWGQLSKLFDVAEAEFGGVDIVTPGAGVFEPPESNFWQPPGGSNSVSKDPVKGLGHYMTLDINIVHPFRMTQLAISHFLNPKGGRAKASPSNPKRIVHIASIASEIALLPTPMYIASKWAVSGFVRSMDGLEAQLGIRVNAVAPGIVLTPLWQDHPEKMKYVDETKDIWVTPQEVAVAMLKLAEDADMVGGTVLECGHERTRVIPIYNNPGPSGAGHSVSAAGEGIAEVFERLDAKSWGVVN